MKKLIYIFAICFLFSSIGIGAPQASEGKPGATEAINMTELLRKMEGADWQERNNMLSEIRSNVPKLTEAETTLLIEIFDRESRFQAEYVQKLRDEGIKINPIMDRFRKEYIKKGYMRYFVAFAELVISLKDTRIIPGMLRGLNNYGGAIVPSHFTSIGRDAIATLVDLMDSKERVLRVNATSMLVLMMKAPIQTEDYFIPESMAIKDAELLEKLKAIFLKALHDEDIDVRLNAVFGLAVFPEQEVLKALEEVAKNDPEFAEYKGNRYYIIREAAKRSIRKMKEKMKNK